MKRTIALAALLLAMTGPASGSGYDFPNPTTEPIAYEGCPAAVRATAWPGMILFIPGAVVGAVVGLVIAPFTSAEAVGMSVYTGALGGNMLGSGITGAPAYGIYRLFSGHGCVGGSR